MTCLVTQLENGGGETCTNVCLTPKFCVAPIHLFPPLSFSFSFLSLGPDEMDQLTNVAGESAKFTQSWSPFEVEQSCCFKHPHKATSLVPSVLLWAPHTDAVMIHSTKIGPWEGKGSHKTSWQFYNIFLGFTGILGSQGWQTTKCLGRMSGPQDPDLVKQLQVFCTDSTIFKLCERGRAVQAANISSDLCSLSSTLKFTAYQVK